MLLPYKLHSTQLAYGCCTDGFGWRRSKVCINRFPKKSKSLSKSNSKFSNRSEEENHHHFHSIDTHSGGWIRDLYRRLVASDLI